MSNSIEIQMGAYRPVYGFDLNGVACRRGQYVIIEVDKISEYGRVVSDPHAECRGRVEKGQGKVVRAATDGDLKQIENNGMKARDAQNVCIEKIVERRLLMQVVKAEYTFDCSKIIFFFVADGRVDFRSLVQDLAKIFRVRIELKQIGVRDKAKIVSGYGVCGRALCCSSYMKGFHPLSVKMAKEQGLPLNPSRTSGVCGRIKCCMAYEFSVYKELSRSLPNVGDKITLPEGKGKVIDVNVLRRYARVDLGDGQIVKAVFDKEESKV